MKIKSGDSMSTRYLNVNLFRLAPSMFHVIALKNAVAGMAVVEEEPEDEDEKVDG